MLTFTDDEFKRSVQDDVGHQARVGGRGVRRPRRGRPPVDRPHPGEPVHPAQGLRARLRLRGRDRAAARGDLSHQGQHGATIPPCPRPPIRTAGRRSTATSPTLLGPGRRALMRRSRPARPPACRRTTSRPPRAGCSSCWRASRARADPRGRHARRLQHDLARAGAARPAAGWSRWSSTRAMPRSPARTSRGRAGRGRRGARRPRARDPARLAAEGARPVRPRLHRRRQGRQRGVPRGRARALTTRAR